MNSTGAVRDGHQSDRALGTRRGQATADAKPAAHGQPLPQRWQHSAVALVAVWLLFSPVPLAFDGEPWAVRNTALAAIVLLLIVIQGMVAVRTWPEWTEIAVGLWLAFSSWLFGFESRAASANGLIAGIAVFGLALWSLHDRHLAIQRTYRALMGRVMR